MSEQKFKRAKGSLAFSQSLKDKLNPHQNMAQPSPEMAQPQAQPPQQEQQPDLVSTIKEVLTPMFDDLKKELQKESQQVELKIEGEMTPKE